MHGRPDGWGISHAYPCSPSCSMFIRFGHQGRSSALKADESRTSIHFSETSVSSMNKLVQKIFTSFVSLTTIAWSVGLASIVPSAAHAAMLSTGALIKASGPAVYYYAADGKRYVFPNSTTYFTWYQDFSSVQTISDADLAAISIGGNVTIRPGTRLVKITTDPKVYAVTPGGVLNWVASESVATALWGSNWAHNVVDVSDAFFVNYNSTAGSTISSPIHPDGSLITYAGSSNRYVVMGGQARLISTSPDAFVANNFNAANVITTTITYPAGAPVNGLEAALGNTVNVGATPVTTVSGSLNVALAADTPAGMTVPRNAASQPMAKFNLSATGGNVTVSSVTLTRVGIGSTTDMTNVYLFDQNGNRLTPGLTVNSINNQVQFNNLNLMIPSGQTVALSVRADFSVASGSTGGQHSFQLVNASAVSMVTSTSTSAATVTGAFPITGNVFTVGSILAGRLDVQVGSTVSNPNVGSQNVEIANFKLVANTDDIAINSVTLIQTGSVLATDLTNLALFTGSTQVASAPGVVNNHIVLTFNPPYLLTAGTSRNFSLHGNVAGRTTRTIQTYVEYGTDVSATDNLYHSGAGVCIAQTATGACTTTGQGSYDGTTSPLTAYSLVTTQGGTITVAFNGPVSQNISRAALSVPFLNFALTNQNNDVLVRQLSFKIRSATGAMVVGSNGTQYLRNLKIVNLATGQTLMGPTSIPSTVANRGTDTGVITISQPFTLPANSTMNLSIQADIANSEDIANQFYGSGTSTYYAVLSDGTNIFGSNTLQVAGTGEFLGTSTVSPNTSLQGNTMTVKSSSLTVNLASTPVTSNVVSKQASVPAVGFVFSAGSQNNVSISSVKFTGEANVGAGYSLTNLRTVAQSCGLFDGLGSTAAQFGTSQTPDATLGTINLTNLNLNIPHGTSKTLYVRCALESTVAAPAGDKFNIGIAANADVTAQDDNSNSVTASVDSATMANSTGTSQPIIMTVIPGGALTIAAGNMRASDIVVAGGSTWQPLAEFRASAQYEDIRIDRIAVTSTVNSANFAQIAVATNGAVAGWDVLPSGFNQNKDIDLSASPLVVPNGSSLTFQLWGQLSPTVASSTGDQLAASAASQPRSGNQVALGLASNITTNAWNSNYNDKFNVRAYGASSGNIVYATSTNMTGGLMGNSFTVRRSRPYVARQALSTTTLASGLDSDLYKFQVAADPAGSISLKKMVFNLSVATSSMSSSLTLSNFRLRRGTTDVTSNIRIVDDNGNNLYGGSWTMASTTGQVIVEFTGTNEDTISGSGNVYTLHATVGGTVLTGDTVSVSMRRQSTGTVNTGYLTNSYVTSSSLIPGPNLDTATAPSGVSGAEGTFVWSDLSENPHSANSAVGGPASSRDWTDDLNVQDLTATQVLSR